MKICYVAIDVILPYHRGSSTHTYEIARNLIKLGHEVHVISRRLSGRQSKHEVLSGVRVYRINRGILIPLKPRGWQVHENGTPLYARILRKVYRLYLRSIYLLYAAVYTAYMVRRHNADVIFERGSSLGAGALAAKLMRKPLVLEIIDPNYASISVKTAKKIFIYTKSVLRENVNDDKLITVTAGADIGLFRPDINGGEVRRKYNISEETPVVGYAGIFAQWHGVEDLTEASKIILKEVPEVKFLMVGPNYNHTQGIVEKAYLGKAFIFTGPVPYDEVPKYVAASDVIVAPYNPAKNLLMRRCGYYFSPIKVFEAMACGKPVVSTSIDIVKDTIRNEETGFLVPSGDPKALAYTTIKILKDKERATKVGANARKLIEEKYSWLAVTKVIDNVLQDVLMKNAKAKNLG